MTKNEVVGYFNILSGASVAQVESKDERFKIYDFLMSLANKQSDIMKDIESARTTITEDKERQEYVGKMLQEEVDITEIKLSKQTYYELIDSNKDKFNLGAISVLSKLLEK